MTGAALALAVLAVLPGGASPYISAPKEKCDAILDSFDKWLPLNIHKDQYVVMRWFQHPSIPNCRGFLQSLLIECREQPFLRTVFVLDKDHRAVNPFVSIRLQDGRWVDGAGAWVGYVLDAETLEMTVTVTVTLDPWPGNSPQGMEIRLKSPRESSVPSPVLPTPVSR